MRLQIFGLPRPLSVTLEVRTEYLKATLGLVKCLEISKELIRECVTMPGCCCYIPLLHNHLMDSCSYNLCTQKYITRRQRGVQLHPPYPPGSATGLLAYDNILKHMYSQHVRNAFNHEQLTHQSEQFHSSGAPISLVPLSMCSHPYCVCNKHEVVR